MESTSFTRVDWEKFRHDLAYPMGMERVSYEDTAAAFDYLVTLCGMLPRFYGDQLDRTNLWGRIESGLSVVSSRCSRVDEIADCMLAHVCADTVRVAASDDLRPLFTPQVKLAAVKQIIATRRLLVICKAREAWMEARS